MDTDLLADVLSEERPALSGNLLSHLPDRPLTNHEAAAQVSSSISYTPGLANPNQAGEVVSKIEAIFEKIAGCILEEKKELVIKLKTRGKQGAKTRNVDTGIIKSLPDDTMREVKFPSKSPKEAWRFSELCKRQEVNTYLLGAAALLRILELSHEALIAGVVTTKRSSSIPTNQTPFSIVH